MKGIITFVLIGFVFSLCSQHRIALPDGGGQIVATNTHSCISDKDRVRIWQKINANKAKLKNSRHKNNSADVLLDWPIRMRENDIFENCYAISNYVDHDFAIGPDEWNQFGDSNIDYNCGKRTYDTHFLYNHSGVDVTLWPFSWYMVENDLVEVVSAAAGTIIEIEDGNADRNCACAGAWNAIYIMHADSSIAWYGHLKKNAFTDKGVGETVDQGEFLGIVASSGCSTGPHLHFELYNDDELLIDPFQGICNSRITSSWWEDQQPYRKPTLNAIITHSEAPSFSCGDEVPNFRRSYEQGESLVTAFYFRDQLQDSQTDIEVIDPFGGIWSSWQHISPETYSQSYWYWTFDLPIDGLFGTWQVKATYEGITVIKEFEYSRETALPVVFSEIEASCEQNGLVEVMTKIESEYKTERYVIETSNDGIDFQSVYQYPATRSSNYTSTIETNKKLGRIKIVDEEGRNTYSEIFGLPTCKGSEDIEITLYPNPVTQDISVSKGKILKYSTTNGKAFSKLQSLPQGVNLVHIEFDNKVYIRKFIKIN